MPATVVRLPAAMVAMARRPVATALPVEHTPRQVVVPLIRRLVVPDCFSDGLAMAGFDQRREIGFVNG